MSKGLSHGRTSLVTGLELALSRSPRPFSLALLWRWRYELIMAAGVPLAAFMIFNWLGPIKSILLAALLAVCMAVPSSSREVIAARAWCVITPHRVRVGCVQARIYSRKGRLPVILRTSPQPSGERVLIWCTAGTSAEDFQDARAILRAACWAADVRADRSPRYAHLITLDVVRRQAAPPGSPQRRVRDGHIRSRAARPGWWTHESGKEMP